MATYSMNSKLLTFEDYQGKYETFILPQELSKRFDFFRHNVHRLFFPIDEFYQQWPDVIIKTIQLSVAIFSCFPSLEFFLQTPKLISKEAKNFTDFIRGLKFVDGILNLSQFSLKIVILNISGTILFILSTMTLIDRFRLLDVSAIKMKLATTPIFGVLPYGGLIAFSLLGIMGPAILLTLEGKRKLEKKLNRIQEEKLTFWSQPLNSEKIEKKLKKYNAKIDQLKIEEEFYLKEIIKGKQIEQQLQNSNQLFRLQNCRKAIQKLASLAEEKKNILKHYETKSSQWRALKKNWDHLSPQTLKDFQEAKINKWQTKLNKINHERKMNLLLLAGTIASLFRQFLAIGGAMAGYGVVAFPLVINAGLEIVISGGGIANFFIKKVVQNTEESSIELSQYVHFTND